MTQLVDFDTIDNWTPQLSEALKGCVSESTEATLKANEPEYAEDALNLLFGHADRNAVIGITLDWVRSTTIVAYHGTRLTDAEVESIRAVGLVPLKAARRRVRLARALARHPRWSDVASQLDAVIESYGRGKAGNRLDQVHLTLSRSGLTNDFPHYLTHGAEFDQHVASALLGSEGMELLRSDGEGRIVQLAVPGGVALDAAHPHFSIDEVCEKGDLPNIVGDFLTAWSFRLAYEEFQCSTLEVDCGMVFQTTVPARWIISIDTVTQ